MYDTTFLCIIELKNSFLIFLFLFNVKFSINVEVKVIFE